MSTPSEQPISPAKQDAKELPPALQLTRDLLEQQTREFLDAFNTRNWETLETQWSNLVDHDRFTGTVGNHAPALSWKEHIDVYRHMAHAKPNLHIKPIQIDSHIKDEEGTAELFVFAELTGHEGGIKTQGLSNLSWRQKRGGQWLCVKHTILQAMGDVEKF
ncbi:hypothetical protein M409DRAFT_27352 [Zasmidium cellare ATCC 36951]|uniref:SnoaL-like domain-containing protein n=1 Tax=Zasmidium cellare ATCC 36951 TaxID=1080233 RepID=A0A6A6C7X3_ZASCE|nr:uncharacterized protein M409DRAFT_27352 [Zasmidium cellare ATCC 36951]KAF2162348.1 hypothetical protein M409DRAFT_27352 [Zasmidium cellare ATCC 36951]